MSDQIHAYPTHSRFAAPAMALAVAVSMAIATVPGCASAARSEDVYQSQGGVPEWVKTLHEPIAELPELHEPSFVPKWEVTTGRVGQPRDLTRRVETSGRSENLAASATLARGPAPGTRTATTLENPALERLLIQGDANATSPLTSLPAGTRALTSHLETFYRGEIPERPDRRLQQFGYDHFEHRSLEISDASFGPVSDDYVVGVADELLVTIRSEVVERYELQVDRSGQIAVPGIGTIAVAGQRLADARRGVEDAVAEFRRDFELDVSLGRLTGIRLRVVGEVIRPGAIDLPAGAGLLDALASAAIRKTGSLRTVAVQRSGREPVVVDLYDYLAHGLMSTDVLIEAGDVIVVPPIGRTIGVAGSVQRPAIYELAPGQSSISVSESITLAGGSTAFTVNDQMQIERTIERRRQLVDITEEPLRTDLRDGDLLLVGAVDGRLHPIVAVGGEVARAGRFQYREGMTVGDLVRLSGSLTAQAYTRQALLSRQVGSPAARNTLIDGASEPTSRRVLVISLERALVGDPEHDVVLEPLDHLRVLRPEDAHDLPTVELIGAVRRAGTYELTAGLRASDLIAIAGNLSPNAYRSEAELIRRCIADEPRHLDVQRYRLDLERVLTDTTYDPLLQTGDRLIIRRLTEAEVRVSVKGRVRFPGEYVLPAGATIVDMLEAAGGVLADADLRASLFTRQSVQTAQQQRWNDLIERTRQTFERNLEKRVNSARPKEAMSARIQLEQAEATVDRLREMQATGRIVLPFDRPDFPGSEYDLPLEPGDRLIVPRQKTTVTVAGYVFNPVTLVHEGDMSVQSILDRAGGTTEFADEKRIYVIRAEGTVSAVQQEKDRLVLSDPLLPGDTVFVPRRPLSRDFGSVVLDTLMIARTAAEAGLLGNAALSDINDVNVSVIDTPASTRNDSWHAPEVLRDLLGQ